MTSQKLIKVLAICFTTLFVSCSTKLISIKDKQAFPSDFGKPNTVLIIGNLQFQDINNLEDLITKNYKGEYLMYGSSAKDSSKYKDTDKYRFEMKFFSRMSQAVSNQNLRIGSIPEYTCGVLDKKTNITYRIAGPYFGSKRKPIKRCLQVLESYRKRNGG